MLLLLPLQHSQVVLEARVLVDSFHGCQHRVMQQQQAVFKLRIVGSCVRHRRAKDRQRLPLHLPCAHRVSKPPDQGAATYGRVHARGSWQRGARGGVTNNNEGQDAYLSEKCGWWKEVPTAP